ncbi:MAG: biopolymer transporter ExbD [Myxococcales bacterium]|nr:biopolymer transporter ExbD [Myxococcales bacterium]
MGMNTGGGSGGIRTEINVTPLVDVVLVLLIIFLVTMPIMMKRITVQVPRKLDDNEILATNNKQLTVLVKENSEVIFNDGDSERTFKLGDLATTMRPILDGLKGDKVVFVDADDNVPWGQVTGAMDTLRSMASDPNNRDEIKIAIKVKEPTDGTAPAAP